MLGVEGTAPDTCLLLGEMTTNSTVQPLTKMDEPVSHLRRYQTVVAYYYSPQAACGPSGSRREVHVFNRCGSAVNKVSRAVITPHCCRK